MLNRDTDSDVFNSDRWSISGPYEHATILSILAPLFCRPEVPSASKRLSLALNDSYGIWEEVGTPLQYSCLENPMDGRAWQATVHGVARSRTRLSNFSLTFHFPALEEEMATHSSVLAWRIPGMGEPGGLPSLGSHRVGHDWSDLAAAAAADPFFL